MGNDYDLEVYVPPLQDSARAGYWTRHLSTNDIGEALLQFLELHNKGVVCRLTSRWQREEQES